MKKQLKLILFLLTVLIVPVLCQASTTILSNESPHHTVFSDSDEQVYGTSASNQINLESGAKAELSNFPGQNFIQIQSSSDLFTVSRSGTVVTFQGDDSTMLKIPATTDVQTIAFTDKTFTLNIYTNRVMLDDQQIITSPTSIQSQVECGAFVAPGVWKEFDCYNLAATGKTTDDDPFTPSWRLIGGYWQWGRKGPTSSQWSYTNTENFAHGPTGLDVEYANDGEVIGWDQTHAPDGAWSDDYKTTDDPCPDGFRIPTLNQWEGVIANNTQNIIGTWSTGWNDHINYSSGRHFGNQLMLPAGGYRDYNNGALYGRGINGSYWSSTESTSDTAWYLNVYESYESYSNTNHDSRRFGCSVRCVAFDQQEYPVLSVTPKIQTVESDSGITAFNVSNAGTGTMNWTAEILSGDEWLSIISGDSGSNTGTITCQYDANLETEIRTTHIRITSPGISNSPIDIEIIQTPEPPEEFTVTFKDHEGTVLKTETVEHGSSATAPDDPARDGYTFNGWDVAFDSVTGNLTVTAQYDINQYTISFDSNGGSPVESIVNGYGESLMAPDIPTRIGYTFVGWNPVVPATMPAESITLTAQWTINQYSLAYTAGQNGSISGSAFQMIVYGSEGSSVTANPDLGYHFVQWSDGTVENPRQDTDITGNLKVTASFAINEYTVTFVGDDGTILQTMTVDHGSSATAPDDPVREGHTFTGWDTSFDSVTGDLTVTATFDNYDSLFTRSPSNSGVNIQGYWQAGSSFSFSITNISNLNFNLFKAELKNGNTVVGETTDISLLSDGLLEPSESVSLRITLNLPLQDQDFVFIYYLSDNLTGVNFEIQHEYGQQTILDPPTF